MVIGLFAGEPSIVSRIESCSRVFLPVTVLGELYYGALRSTRRPDNIGRIEQFARRVAVLPCIGETAHHYGRVKDNLSVKGKPIPENDIWIAALAVQHNLTLLTRDRHFTAIDGLEMELLP